MKRFFILILSLSLCIMFTLSGCSCTGETILEFNSTQVNNIDEEILTYSVNLEKDYNEIKRSNNIDASILPEYQNGIYLAKYQTNVAFPDCSSNLSYPDNGINKIETTLTIDVVDKKENKTYKDQIYTEVYFYDGSLSYAPIYSKTIVKNTYIANDATTIELVPQIYQYSVTYNKNTYVMEKKSYETNEDISGEINLNELDPTKLVPMTGDGQSYEYQFRHLIDNNQLVFATRSLSIAKNQRTLLPIVNYMYPSPSKLEVVNTAISSFNIESSLGYSIPSFNNAYDKTLSIPAKNIRISLYDTHYTGLPKYVTVQNDSADNGKLLNNGLVLEYAEPLISASFICLGALVYTINSVSITYNT